LAEGAGTVGVGGLDLLACVCCWFFGVFRPLTGRGREQAARKPPAKEGQSLQPAQLSPAAGPGSGANPRNLLARLPGSQVHRKRSWLWPA